MTIKQPDMMEIMQRREPLHEDLQPYVVESNSLGDCLKHPLLFAVPYVKEWNGLHNFQYLAKKAHVEEKIAEGKHASVLFMYERPHRFEKLLEWIDEIEDDKTFWKLMGNCWTDTENMWQMEDEVISLLECGRPGRDNMMDEDEKALLDSMPDKVAIYRGHQRYNKLGYCWTLSYWRARWFAQRFDHKGKGYVARAEVSKDDIYAILLGRGEYEIALIPQFCNSDNGLVCKDIRDIKRPDWIANVMRLAKSEYKLDHDKSYHGWTHWQQVERHALRLAKAVPGADSVVCQLFALIHDCQRENEDEDPRHGRRGADFASKLKSAGALKIDDQQFNLLYEACNHHNDGKVSDDPTIGVCWDADRLDLPRVHITPDPKFLSTEAAKKLMWTI